MILYLDTGALVKKYAWESGSGTIIRLWQEAEGIAISKVGYAETVAAFYHKKREEELTGKLSRRILKNFQEDWKSFVRIDLSNEIEELIDQLVMKYPLRGLDAIHLASCLTIKKALKGNLTFVAADRRLIKAAQKEHLNTHDVSEGEC